MENASRKTNVEMQTLLLCRDVQFLGTTRGVLKQLGAAPQILESCDAALEAIAERRFDAVVVDWREIHNLGDFLASVCRSKLNQDCVLVAIVRDLLDLRQAFSAGVHFLIHKPASTVQIERCLRAAYMAGVARRRKHYRQEVKISAAFSTRNISYASATIVNLGEGGVALDMNSNSHPGTTPIALRVGDPIHLNFLLPGTHEPIHSTGMVVWANFADQVGVRFDEMPDAERQCLERWLTSCVERSVAATQEQPRLDAVSA